MRKEYKNFCVNYFKSSGIKLSINALISENNYFIDDVIYCINLALDYFDETDKITLNWNRFHILYQNGNGSMNRYQYELMSNLCKFGKDKTHNFISFINYAKNNIFTDDNEEDLIAFFIEIAGTITSRDKDGEIIYYDSHVFEDDEKGNYFNYTSGIL